MRLMKIISIFILISIISIVNVYSNIPDEWEDIEINGNIIHYLKKKISDKFIIFYFPENDKDGNPYPHGVSEAHVEKILQIYEEAYSTYINEENLAVPLGLLISDHKVQVDYPLKIRVYLFKDPIIVDGNTVAGFERFDNNYKLPFIVTMTKESHTNSNGTISLNSWFKVLIYHELFHTFQNRYYYYPKKKIDYFLLEATANYMSYKHMEFVPKNNEYLKKIYKDIQSLEKQESYDFWIFYDFLEKNKNIKMKKIFENLRYIIDNGNSNQELLALIISSEGNSFNEKFTNFIIYFREFAKAIISFNIDSFSTNAWVNINSNYKNITFIDTQLFNNNFGYDYDDSIDRDNKKINEYIEHDTNLYLPSLSINIVKFKFSECNIDIYKKPIDLQIDLKIDVVRSDDDKNKFNITFFKKDEDKPDSIYKLERENIDLNEDEGFDGIDIEYPEFFHDYTYKTNLYKNISSNVCMLYLNENLYSRDIFGDWTNPRSTLKYNAFLDSGNPIICKFGEKSHKNGGHSLLIYIDDGHTGSGIDPDKQKAQVDGRCVGFKLAEDDDLIETLPRSGLFEIKLSEPDKDRNCVKEVTKPIKVQAIDYAGNKSESEQNKDSGIRSLFRTDDDDERFWITVGEMIELEPKENCPYPEGPGGPAPDDIDIYSSGSTDDPDLKLFSASDFDSISTKSDDSEVDNCGKPIEGYYSGMFTYGFFGSADLLSLNYNHGTYLVHDTFPFDYEKFKLLILPSGSLNSRSNDYEFAKKIDEYVSSGGIVFCFSQEKGSDFKVLPGSPDGFGYVEDQNCFTSSTYIDTWHPMLASITRNPATAHFDGFFTEYPSDATVLLRRTANGQPCLLIYPYGNGHVILSSLYTDYAYGVEMASFSEIKLVRDIIAWSKKEEGRYNIPEVQYRTYSRGVPVEIENTGNTEAVSVQFELYTPEKTSVNTRTYSINLSSGQSSTIMHNIQFYVEDLGIWWVGYKLFDSNGNQIADECEAKRMAVIYKPEPYEGNEITCSLTCEFENVVEGEVAPFDLHIWNNTGEQRTVDIYHDWLHHFRTFYKTIILEPRSETVETIQYRIPATESDLGRLWVHLIDPNDSGTYNPHEVPFETGKYLTSTSKVVKVIDSPFEVTIQADKEFYQGEDEISIFCNIKNKMSTDFTDINIEYNFYFNKKNLKNV